MTPFGNELNNQLNTSCVDVDGHQQGQPDANGHVPPDNTFDPRNNGGKGPADGQQAQPGPTTPPPAQQQGLNADLKNRAVQRATQGLTGTANLLDASLRSKALVGGVVALAENPPAAATFAVYGVVSIFGQSVTGTAQITEAVTGNSSGIAHKAEEVGNMLSGPAAGLVTAATTHDLNKAAAAGNAESLYTGGTGLVDKSVPILQRLVEFRMSLMGLTDGK